MTTKLTREIDIGTDEEVKLITGSHNRIIIEKVYGPTCVKELVICWEGSDWNLRKAFDKGFKQGQLSQQKSELRFLKSINNGASYCWMCNKIDKRIKQIQGVKT